jgi:hypothetical protein
MKTKVLTGSAWIITAGLFFFLGWVYKDSFSEQPEEKEEQPTPLKEPAEKTPENNLIWRTFDMGKEIEWQLKNKDDYRSVICRANAAKDGKTLKSTCLYDVYSWTSLFFSLCTTLVQRLDKANRLPQSCSWSST